MGIKNTKPTAGSCSPGHYVKSVTRVADLNGNTLSMCYNCTDGKKWCDNMDGLDQVPITNRSERTMGCDVAMTGLALEDDLNMKAIYCAGDNIPSSCGDKCKLLSCGNQYVGGLTVDDSRPKNSFYNSYLSPTCYAPPPPKPAVATIANPDGSSYYPPGTDSTSTGASATSMQQPILGLPPMLFWFILIVAAALGVYSMSGSSNGGMSNVQGMQGMPLQPANSG